MCGIAGFIGNKNNMPSLKQIKNCKNSLERRGPDANGLYKNVSKKKAILFVHTRLSIVDLNSEASQPFSDHNGTLIFNGMIYNYIELRKLLEKKGEKFKTTSDTEVLLKMLNIYKEKAFKEGHMATAAQSMRYLSAIMNYGKAEEINGEPLIQDNPVNVLKGKRIQRTIKPKERYIEKEQLFSFIRALMTEIHRDARDVLLMELFTGLRDIEVKSLEWSDCDFNQKHITIKNNKSSYSTQK